MVSHGGESRDGADNWVVSETESWLQLVSTHPDHRMLDQDTRARLSDRIPAAVDASGGRIEVGYTTVGYFAWTHDRLGEWSDA
jgi:hypothetical protein